MTDVLRGRITFVFLMVGLVLGSTSAQTGTEEGAARITRFGWREINLPGKLENDELRLENHRLDNNIAKLEGRAEDVTLMRITVDLFLLDQDKAAVKLANRFAQVWSNVGDRELQGQLADADQQLDGAVKKCNPTGDDAPSGPAETLEQAEENCADLRKIDAVVSRYNIKVSVPPPSVFRHRATFNSTAESLLRADDLQLKADMAARWPANVKQMLTKDDQGLIRMDKMIWLAEFSHAGTIKHNAEHPEQPYADDLYIVRELLSFRERVAGIAKEYRRKIVSLQTQGR